MREPHRLIDLTAYTLSATDGEIGELEQIYFDDRQWIVRYFVVRTGGWLFGRRVLIVPSVIKNVDNEARTIEIDLSREQIEHSPPVNTEKPVSRHYEQAYFRYYGWKPYWTGDLMQVAEPHLSEPAAGLPEEPEHPHLRSSDEVRNYGIRARDGEIGQVKDFILEEPDWTIRYLEVDTRKWLPGKHVLLETSWIEQVEWDVQQVTVDLSRETIETAPPYDPSKVIDRAYQVALYKHYGTGPGKK